MNDPATELANRILDEFDNRIDIYRAFTGKLESLFKEILPVGKVHKVEARTKKRENLFEKLLRPEKRYSKLDDVEDIVGLRVITYFASDVPSIFKFIKYEFQILESDDKENRLQADQFGYVSVHCVACLKASRLKHAEYKKFSGLKTEIQIRSILQHAWAEIEHDLGYKSPQALPRRIRRPFSRLAGLLELGDLEFERIRKKVAAYLKELKRGKNDEVEIDKDSVSAFIKTSPEIKKIDSDVAAATGLRIVPSDTFVELFVERLTFVGLQSIGKIEELLKRDSAVIGNFIRTWFAETGKGRSQLIPEGVAISFLCWKDLLDKGGLPLLILCLEKTAFNKAQDLRATAKGLSHAYEKAKLPPSYESRPQ